MNIRLSAERVVSNRNSIEEIADAGRNSFFDLDRRRMVVGWISTTSRALVEHLEQRIEYRLAEIDAVIAGEQADAVELHDVERVDCLLARAVHIRHRQRRIGAEPLRVFCDVFGRLLVDAPRQRARLGVVAVMRAGHRQRIDAGRDAVLVLEIERHLRRPVRCADDGAEILDRRRDTPASSNGNARRCGPRRSA